jgi:hypothetical protein
VEATLQPLQLLAAAALFRYTAIKAYARKPVKTRGGQDDHKAGLMFVVALGLEHQYRTRYDRRSANAGFSAPDEIVNRMYDHIAEWTDEIEGSINDADPVEVNINADDPLNGARPKRKINAAAFETEALRRRFLMDAPGAPPLLPSPQPPSSMWHSTDEAWAFSPGRR